VGFTGAVSSSPPPSEYGGSLPGSYPTADAGPDPDGGPVPARRGRRGRGVPSAAAYWRGWPEVRADLRVCALLVLLLAAVGLLAGLVWWGVAPRADFRIEDAGPVAIGNPSEELFAADDAVFALVLAGFGFLTGVAAWFLRHRRGVAMLLALAVGCSAMAAVAWQLGELLGAGPTKAELSDVGAVVTTALTLHSLPALAVAPFAALLGYVMGVLYVPRDDLGRTGEPTVPAPPDGRATVTAAADEELALADAPPSGRPRA
jgi:hypothetical protein